VQVFPRGAWTKTARPVDDLTPLVKADVRGLAIHYTGSKTRFGDNPTLKQSAARLEGERLLHVLPPPRGKGWTDIAYMTGFDQAGRVFDLRGVKYRSAANGDQDVNQRFGAVTWLLGVGDKPTPALLAAFEAWWWAVWVPMYPHATQLVGHRDLHATDCPGDPTYQLIESGELARALTPQEDADMAITEAQLDQKLAALEERLAQRLTRQVADAVTGAKGALHPVLVDEGTGEAELPDGRDIDSIPTVLAEMQVELRELLTIVKSKR
jgi:hypothetical protein